MQPLWLIMQPLCPIMWPLWLIMEPNQTQAKANRVSSKCSKTVVFTLDQRSGDRCYIGPSMLVAVCRKIPVIKVLKLKKA
jgi:hypothetical protein